MTTIDPERREAALTNKAWPYQEAGRVLKRYPDGKPDGAPILFETGYGPSGLPHIGTFNEVLRTTMVRRALEEMSGLPTRLIAFSDDMDGLRKVPDNVPNKDMLTEHLGRPLSRIPDPFETHESFAAHNNARLRAFLDQYGFDYDFMSSTEQYASGAFDETLKLVLQRYDKIMGVMLPTLREERRATYSPVLPVSPKSGGVLQVPVTVLDPETGMIRFEDEGESIEQSIFGGQAKLQWKADWAMRWVALGVDYEMYGKDLTDSGVQSGKIAKVLGGRKPEGMIYEMFLDAQGEKISKSKGNGLSIEEWLTYGPEESLAFYIYRDPKAAKQLHTGLIPKVIDDYFQMRANYPAQGWDKRLGNPVHHVHGGDVPDAALPVPYSLLLNLVGVMGSEADEAAVWAYLQNYAPGATPETEPELAKLVGHAVRYVREIVAPSLEKRAPSEKEAAALRDLDDRLAAMDADVQAEDIQTAVYEVGKAHDFEPLRAWFSALYETLLGSSQGPRMGSFVSLYGIDNTRRLIAEALER
ncbi:lysine--tRNA ligase [Pacificimonas flava]|uniref:Lysine--tRNA ligase n=2 Tax=Pacificimonas TaxID=1960290 RepID=A0A219B2M5_9SPHN|nr:MULTISPECIES: lysine--tRNA ligase [Pacificimonas]MBZ6377754.1 lysine--tRNA ligase [Pacificimonas aurantium]OWV32571.1 lysine--tRNA ligase [Pacificimonas flava]